MFTLNLTTRIKKIDGGDILTREDNKPLTIKDVFLNTLGMHKSKDGATAIKVYDLGIRINRSKEIIELKSEDIELLKNIISSNILYVDVITAQILNDMEK